MIKFLKCWFWGHDWKQVGHQRIRHQVVNDNGVEVESCHRDHLLFICRNCQEIKEHHLKVNYNPSSEELSFVNVEEEG